MKRYLVFASLSHEHAGGLADVKGSADALYLAARLVPEIAASSGRAEGYDTVYIWDRIQDVVYHRDGKGDWRPAGELPPQAEAAPLPVVEFLRMEGRRVVARNVSGRQIEPGESCAVEARPPRPPGEAPRRVDGSST